MGLLRSIPLERNPLTAKVAKSNYAKIAKKKLRK
jgi:hypothetical protein